MGNKQCLQICKLPVFLLAVTERSKVLELEQYSGQVISTFNTIPTSVNR